MIDIAMRATPKNKEITGLINAASTRRVGSATTTEGRLTDLETQVTTLTPQVEQLESDVNDPAFIGQYGYVTRQQLAQILADFVMTPDVLYETDGTTGILGVNNNALGENWQLTGYDFTPYKYLRCHFKMADMSDSSNALTPAMVVHLPLDAAVTAKAANDSTTLSPKDPCTMYIAGAAAPNPSDQNRVFTVLVAVDTTKTKLQVVCENSLYGTAQTNRNTDGRYLYKIEGCYA